MYKIGKYRDMYTLRNVFNTFFLKNDKVAYISSHAGETSFQTVNGINTYSIRRELVGNVSDFLELTSDVAQGRIASAIITTKGLNLKGEEGYPIGISLLLGKIVSAEIKQNPEKGYSSFDIEVEVRDARTLDPSVCPVITENEDGTTTTIKPYDADKDFEQLKNSNYNK